MKYKLLGVIALIAAIIFFVFPTKTSPKKTTSIKAYNTTIQNYQKYLSNPNTKATSKFPGLKDYGNNNFKHGYYAFYDINLDGTPELLFTSFSGQNKPNIFKASVNADKLYAVWTLQNNKAINLVNGNSQNQWWINNNNYLCQSVGATKWIPYKIKNGKLQKINTKFNPIFGPKVNWTDKKYANAQVTWHKIN